MKSILVLLLFTSPLFGEDTDTKNPLEGVKVKIHAPEKSPVIPPPSQPQAKPEERTIIRTPRGSMDQPLMQKNSQNIPEGQQLPQELIKSGKEVSRDKFQQYMEELNQHRVERSESAHSPMTRVLPEQTHNVRMQIHRQYPNYRNWFTSPFFERHRYRSDFTSQQINMWQTPRWKQINRWLGSSWSYPIYFNQHAQLVELPSIVEEEGSEIQSSWAPLGVFVLSQSLEQIKASNLFIQLALNKNGDVAGTFYDASKDLISSLDGLLDKKNQQIAFKLTEDPDSPFMITGLYDLTQEVAPLQVIFPNGSRQIWLLVKITN